MEPSHRSLVRILVFALLLDTFVSNFMSQTMDEADHLEYGTRILHGQPDRSGPYMDIKTPVTALNALPRVIGVHFDNESSPRIRKFFLSRTTFRIPSILAAVALIWFIYRIAYEMYGRVAGLGAALLAALSPNLIAHGTLATTDGYFALGVVAALYFFRRYLLHPTFANACASGAALALAQIMKPLAAFLYPIAGVFLVFVAVWAAVWHGPIRISAKQVAIYAVTAMVCLIGVLNVAYLFDRTFAPLESYKFQSKPFRALQNAPLVRNIRVPVPYPVLQGLDMAQHNDEIGATYGSIYLLGELRRTSDPNFHGFKSYYVVAWLFKEPIALQILFIWGLIYAWKRKPNPGLRLAEGLLLASLCVLVAGLSLFSKAQIGIRHILPALAIEVIIAGSVLSQWESSSSRKKSVLGLLMLWLAVSTFSYYPHMIPYMNELVLDRKLSYRILADSNLDWGQNLAQVHQFLKDNPDVDFNPDVPVAGRILVSANRLVGVAPEQKGPLLWALRYRPVGHVGYAHFIFEIPPEDVTELSH